MNAVNAIKGSWEERGSVERAESCLKKMIPIVAGLRAVLDRSEAQQETTYCPMFPSRKPQQGTGIEHMHMLRQDLDTFDGVVDERGLRARSVVERKQL